MQSADIETIIEKLTTKGQEHLDKTYLAQLKKYAKSERLNEDVFKYLGRLLLHQLEQNHAQIRYGSILVIAYLFERSNFFRIFVCQHLEQILELCFGVKGCKVVTNGGRETFTSQGLNKKILQPISWAKKLKNKAYEFIEYWNKEFGEGYPILKNACDFIATQNISQMGEHSSSRNLESSTKSSINNNENLIENFKKKLEEFDYDINLLIIQIDTCFELLIPKFTVFEQESNINENITFRPMQGLSFNILLNSKVEITRDRSNSDIIDNLFELCSELDKFKDKLTNFEKIISEQAFNKETKTIFKNNVKDLQLKITSILWKSNEIKIHNNAEICIENNPSQNCIENKNESDSDEDSDSDFEEVTEREDLFLVNKIEALKTKNDVPKGMIEPKQNEKTHLSQADINQCRAQLPSGRLCPRRDLVKCPFHGKIIPRDDEGFPLDEEIKKNEMEAKFLKEANEWKDPKYLKELSKQTGRDLTCVNLRKRKKHPDLVDIKQLNSTPKQRLKRKIRKEYLDQFGV